MNRYPENDYADRPVDSEPTRSTSRLNASQPKLDVIEQRLNLINKQLTATALTMLTNPDEAAHRLTGAIADLRMVTTLITDIRVYRDEGLKQLDRAVGELNSAVAKVDSHLIRM